MGEKNVEESPIPPNEDALTSEGNAFRSDQRLVQKHGSFQRLAASTAPQMINYTENHPRDPLKWKQWKKNSFLIIISSISFLADFWQFKRIYHFTPTICAMETPAFHHQPRSFGTAAWCGAATNFDSFMTARILNGFFSTVAQAGGLMWIKDMYIPSERAHKINIWSSFIIISPFVGPACICLHYHGVYWVLCVLFLDETFANRKAVGDALVGRKSRILRPFGVEQRRKNLIGNTFTQALERPVVAITKLPVFLSSLYYMFVCAWVIGLNAAISVFIKETYYFRYDQIVLAARVYAKRHKNRIDPEAHLLPVWVATPMMVVGTVMVGVCFRHRYHETALAVVWALYVACIIIVTTAINAYCLASYPGLAGEMAAWINEGRILGGFIVNYFEIKWVGAIGAEKALGIQAAVVMAAFSIIVVLQVFGQRLRLERSNPSL